MLKLIYSSILFVVIMSFYSCKKEQNKTINSVKIEFKHEGNLQLIDSLGTVKRNLKIELADNDFERQTGLMYRKKLDTNKGMLFIFDDIRVRSFYMKNTYIPLDIIYIDSNNIILSIIKNAEPLNQKSLPSEGPVKYVLEINAGLSDLWDLQPGDKINYKIL